MQEEFCVGTSYVKTSCGGIIKFYVPPEIHVQEPKTGGRVKRLTLGSLINNKYSLFHPNNQESKVRKHLPENLKKSHTSIPG
ncbi:hypothetical protein GQ457_09G017990 [Hibiscus cannabinus]